jgi:hypothetical protein
MAECQENSLCIRAPISRERASFDLKEKRSKKKSSCANPVDAPPTASQTPHSNEILLQLRKLSLAHN